MRQTVVIAAAMMAMALLATAADSRERGPWSLYVYEQKAFDLIDLRIFDFNTIQECVDAFEALRDQRRKLVRARCIHINASMPSLTLLEENPDTEFNVFDVWRR
jgi:hypothetical protein